MSFDDLQPSWAAQRRVTDRPATNIQIKKSTSATFYGQITLAELREFVRACDKLSATATVVVTKYAGLRNEQESTTIAVNDA